MSEESKTVEEIAQPAAPSELAEPDLDGVAGGKNYFESRSNTASVVPTPVPSKSGGTNPL